MLPDRYSTISGGERREDQITGMASVASDSGAGGVRRVLYHHRTQGKAVEGVHIRGVTDALRAEGIAVDVMSLPGADPYATPAAMAPTRQATPPPVDSRRA